MRTESAADTISVFLLDDHEIVRRGVADLLESDPGRSSAEPGRPAEAGAAVGERLDHRRAVVSPGPLLEVAQAAARALEVDPVSVVDDLENGLVGDVEADRHVGAAGLASRVALALADDGLHVGGELAVDQAVDGAGHAHRRYQGPGGLDDD